MRPSLCPPRFLAGLALGLSQFTAARAQLDYATPYSFYTPAGDGSIGSADGNSPVARFNAPNGVAVDFTDSLSAGGFTYYTVYIADSANDTIRRISKVTRAVTTFAGSAGFPGSADGQGGDARFANPGRLVVDSGGNLYVTDQLNYTIRKITQEGVVSTFAGSAGLSGSADGTGSAARFGVMSGIAVDPAGNLWVADNSNQTIRKITSAAVVTTFAGSPGNSGSVDGTGGAARFNNPQGLQLDAAGNLYVADRGNHTIRKITPTGTVSTLAGSAGNSGSADGTGNAARFNAPGDVSVDAGGNVFVADTGNQTIRKISPAGTVSTLAGAVLSPGTTDGLGSAARFNSPEALMVDAADIAYVADTGNNAIRQVSADGRVGPFAGPIGGTSGAADSTNGASRFGELFGVTASPSGDVYLADHDNHTIRKFIPDGTVSTFAGKAGIAGSANGTGGSASFNLPSGVTRDSTGNLFVADTGNQTIRKITSAGAVTTFAGSPGAQGSTDGTGSAARFAQPYGVAADASGNIYVADLVNATIRKITSSGVVTTLAGAPGTKGNADGTGSAARFTEPRGVATDSAGNVYVADFGSYVVRKVTPAGVVTTLAGQAGAEGSVDGTGSAARFGHLSNVVVDAGGNLFVADTTNNLIRRISPEGKVTTVAGIPGLRGNRDGIGPEATFDFPRGVSLDGAGILYVASGTALRKGQIPAPPTITVQPQSQSVSGGVPQLSVTATGIPPLTYQWYFNGTAIGGAIGSSLLFSGFRSADAGDYTVVVSNGVGRVTSAKATVTVSATPVPPASSGGGNSGGGGGAPSAWFVLALLGLAAGRRRRRPVT